MITDPTYLQALLARIPHQPPFRFVDGILWVSDTGAAGWYTFEADNAVYRGHYPSYPITPGVLLSECMTQSGVLPLALHLDRQDTIGLPRLTHTDIEFRAEVRPGAKVETEATLLYFRRGIIKCQVEMRHTTGEVVSLGTISAVAKV